MAAYGRPALRDLFDDSPTPHIAHPPRTHRRDFYLATDGSFREDGGGLGVIIETRDGQAVERLSRPHVAPDNNVAEYRALHLGLDVLADRASGDARVGVLLDHDELAANVNRATLGTEGPGWRPHPVCVPQASQHHWRGIRARISGFGELRAARIPSGENPAHPLANAPHEFPHVERDQVRCLRPEAPGNVNGEDQIPPPSRANRHAGD